MQVPSIGRNLLPPEALSPLSRKTDICVIIYKYV